MEISGKVAIVTGAGAGIGEALARRLTDGGARVVVADLNEDGARRVGADSVYFLRLRNWGHIPPARFREIDVCDARHPEHDALREMLADRRLAAANVELGTLAQFAPTEALSARP